jgi:hypothetical protein
MILTSAWHEEQDLILCSLDLVMLYCQYFHSSCLDQGFWASLTKMMIVL